MSEYQSQDPQPGGQYPGSAPPPPSYQPPPPPAMPQSVRLAVYCLFTLVVLGLLNVLFGLTQPLADQLRAAQPNLSDAEVEAAVAVARGGSVVFGLIVAALFLWLAFMVRKGRNWARVTLTVLFVLGILYQLVTLLGASPAAVKATTTIMALLELATLVLLWQRPSTGYFSAPRPA